MAVAGVVGDTVVVAVAVVTVLLLVDGVVVRAIVPNFKAKGSWADVTVAPDQESTETRLGEHVQDTVEDGLRVWRNDVATLAESPGDWVKHPEECSQGAAEEEGATGVAANAVGVDACLPDENVDDPEQSDAAKGVVSPLVAGRDKSTNETGDNHDPVDEDDPGSGWPWHGGREHQVREQEGSSDEPGTMSAPMYDHSEQRNSPIDVSNVEDLTVSSTNNGVVARELDSDRSPPKVGSHGEVRNRSDHGDTSSDVVEDTVGSWLHGRQTDEGHCRDGHDGAYRPVEVTAMGGDVDVGVEASDRII